MRRGLLLCIPIVVLFVLGLGAGIGQTLNRELAAAVAGVICGVVASVPVSLGLLLLLGRLPGLRAEAERTGTPAPW